MLAIVRVESGLVHHRQHFTGRDVEHHDEPARAVLDARRALSSR